MLVLAGLLVGVPDWPDDGLAVPDELLPLAVGVSALDPVDVVGIDAVVVDLELLPPQAATNVPTAVSPARTKVRRVKREANVSI